MARINRTEAGVGRADLLLVVAQSPKDSYVAGRLWTRAGWYWHLKVLAPDGQELVGQSHGPHDTEKQARDAGYAVLDAANAAEQAAQ